MEYIHARNLQFTYEGQADDILHGVSFSLDDSSRVGLVGDNGCGKTTLLNLIRGVLAPTAGTLYVKSNLVIGWLPQEARLEDNRTVGDYLWGAREDFRRLRIKMDTADRSSAEYAELVAEYYGRGVDAFETRFEQILRGLDLEKKIIALPLSALSGGEKTKIALARILLTEPEIMLLDEPTNHLEIAALEWLERYLDSSAVPHLIVSHDRRFLDRCVTEIWELADTHLTAFGGNYSWYRREKDRRRQRQLQDHKERQKKIRQLKSAAEQRRASAQKMENFKLSRSVTKSGRICKRDEGSGRSGTSSADRMKTAKALEKRVQSLIEEDRMHKPRRERKRKISFTGDEVKSNIVLRIDNLSRSFGSERVLNDISMAVRTGTTLGIIGCNGSGKSTLLNILAGRLDANAGSFTWSPQARIGYYSQEHEILDPTRTVLDQVLQGKPEDQTSARHILGRLNIRGDKVFQTVASLSLGERSKVALAAIMFSGANVLLLDEPTNHVELSAREAFEEALAAFSGTVILASHDRFLLATAATEILDMESGRHFTGGYQEYTESVAGR